MKSALQIKYIIIIIIKLSSIPNVSPEIPPCIEPIVQVIVIYVLLWKFMFGLNNYILLHQFNTKHIKISPNHKNKVKCHNRLLVSFPSDHNWLIMCEYTFFF